MSSAVSQAIRSARFHDFSVKLEGRGCVPGQTIPVRQTKHRFPFAPDR